MLAFQRLLLALPLTPLAAGLVELKVGFMYPRWPKNFDVSQTQDWQKLEQMYESWQCLKLAIKDVNADPSILPNYTLTYVQVDPGLTPQEAAQSTSSLIAEGVVGIIGPYTSGFTESTAVLSSLMEVPILNPISNSIAQSNKERYPYLFRVGPAGEEVQLRAMAVLCYTLMLQRVVVYTSNQKLGSTAAVLLPAMDALAVSTEGATIDSSLSPLVARNAVRDMVLKYHDAGYRVHLANVPGSDAVFLSMAAFLLNGRGDFPTWVISAEVFLATIYWNFISNVLYVLQTAPITGNRAREAFYARWESIITLYNSSSHGRFDPQTGHPLYGNQSALLHNGTQFLDVSSNVNSQTGEVRGDWQPTPNGLFVYDAVHVLGRALHELAEAGNQPTRGAALRTALMNTNVPGLTGQITFSRTFQDRTAKVPIKMPHPVSRGVYLTVANVTDLLLEGDPSQSGWCRSGCLDSTASDMQSLPFKDKYGIGRGLPDDGRGLSFTWSTFNVRHPLLDIYVVEEGKPFMLEIFPKDGFRQPVCFPECGGGSMLVGTYACYSCQNRFAARSGWAVTVKNSTGHTLEPVAPWISTPGLRSFLMVAPRGFKGSGDYDRPATAQVSYYFPMGRSQNITFLSPSCKVGFSGVPNSCDTCLPGLVAPRRGMTNCTPCDRGTAQPRSGRTACDSCPIGKHAPATGMAECSVCPLGRYQPQDGQAECIRCPQPMITLTTGSVNMTDCICPAGTYRPNGAVILPNMADFPCQPCPVGMQCKRGSDERAFTQNVTSGIMASAPPQLLPAYWSKPDSPMSVFVCLAGSGQCPGGAPGTCGTGLSGVACGVCEEGHYRERGSCYRCPSVHLSRFLFPTLPVIGSIVFVLVLYFTSKDKDGSVSWNLDVKSATHILSICLVYFQTAGLVLRSNIALPGDDSGDSNDSESSWVWNALNKPLGLLQLDCVGVRSFQANIAFNLVLPVYASFAFLAVLGASMILEAGRRGARMDTRVLWSCFGSVLLAFYIGLCALSMDLFKCYEHPNGDKSVKSAPQVLCGSPEWSQMMAVSVTCTIIYCVTSAAIFIWALGRAPKHKTDEEFKKTWKFLLARFRPRGRWWALVWIVKGFLLNLVQVVFVYAQDQLLVMQFLLGGYAALTLWLTPWRHRVVNNVDAAVHIMLALACGPLFWFAPLWPGANQTWRATIVEKCIQMIPPPILFGYIFYKKVNKIVKGKLRKGGARNTVTSETLSNNHRIIWCFCELEAADANEIVQALAPMDRERLVTVCAALEDQMPDVVRKSTTMKAAISYKAEKSYGAEKSYKAVMSTKSKAKAVEEALGAGGEAAGDADKAAADENEMPVSQWNKQVDAALVLRGLNHQTRRVAV